MNGLERSAWLTLLAVAGVAAGCAATQNPPEAAPAPPARQTITFEEFETGQIVSEIPRAAGQVIRVRGDNPHYRANGAVIFDSANWSDDDQDLATPHRDFEIVLDDGTRVPGQGIGIGGRAGSLCENDMPLGKLLIVDEDLEPLTEDGRVAEPDDEGQIGAKLFLDFSALGSVTIYDVTFVDVEEKPATVSFFKAGLEGDKYKQPRNLLAKYEFRTLDNGVVRLFREELREVSEEGCFVDLLFRRHGKVLTPLAGVRMLEVEFAGSGAIDNIVYSVETRKKRLF